MDLYLENNFKISLDEYNGSLKLWQFSKDKIWKPIDDKYFTDLMRNWRQKVELDDLLLKEGG